MGYKLTSEAPGKSEWEMLRKLAAKQRKDIARKAAKALWDEKWREEP
jgi:hypothetical protein